MTTHQPQRRSCTVAVQVLAVATAFVIVGAVSGCMKTTSTETAGSTRATSGQARVVWSNGAKGTARPHCAVSSSRTRIVFYADWHNTGNQAGTSPVLMLETNDN